MVVRLTRQHETCGHCERTDVGSPAAGFAEVNGVRVCHPTVSGRPRCHDLVLRFGHATPCKDCTMYFPGTGMYPIAGSRDAAVWR